MLNQHYYGHHDQTFDHHPSEDYFIWDTRNASPEYILYLLEMYCHVVDSVMSRQPPSPHCDNTTTYERSDDGDDPWNDSDRMETQRSNSPTMNFDESKDFLISRAIVEDDSPCYDDLNTHDDDSPVYGNSPPPPKVISSPSSCSSSSSGKRELSWSKETVMCMLIRFWSGIWNDVLENIFYLTEKIQGYLPSEKRVQYFKQNIIHGDNQMIDIPIAVHRDVMKYALFWADLGTCVDVTPSGSSSSSPVTESGSGDELTSHDDHHSDAHTAQETIDHNHSMEETTPPLVSSNEPESSPLQNDPSNATICGGDHHSSADADSVSDDDDISIGGFTHKSGQLEDIFERRIGLCQWVDHVIKSHRATTTDPLCKEGSEESTDSTSDFSDDFIFMGPLKTENSYYLACEDLMPKRDELFQSTEIINLHGDTSMDDEDEDGGDGVGVGDASVDGGDDEMELLRPYSPFYSSLSSSSSDGLCDVHFEYEPSETKREGQQQQQHISYCGDDEEDEDGEDLPLVRKFFGESCGVPVYIKNKRFIDAHHGNQFPVKEDDHHVGYTYVQNSDGEMEERLCAFPKEETLSITGDEMQPPCIDDDGDMCYAIDPPDCQYVHSSDDLLSYVARKDTPHMVDLARARQVSLLRRTLSDPCIHYPIPRESSDCNDHHGSDPSPEPNMEENHGYFESISSPSPSDHHEDDPSSASRNGTITPVDDQNVSISEENGPGNRHPEDGNISSTYFISSNDQNSSIFYHQDIDHSDSARRVQSPSNSTTTSGHPPYERDHHSHTFYFSPVLICEDYINTITIPEAPLHGNHYYDNHGDVYLPPLPHHHHHHYHHPYHPIESPPRFKYEHLPKKRKTTTAAQRRRKSPYSKVMNAFIEKYIGSNVQKNCDIFAGLVYRQSISEDDNIAGMPTEEFLRLMLRRGPLAPWFYQDPIAIPECSQIHLFFLIREYLNVINGSGFSAVAKVLVRDIESRMKEMASASSRSSSSSPSPSSLGTNEEFFVYENVPVCDVRKSSRLSVEHQRQHHGGGKGKITIDEESLQNCKEVSTLLSENIEKFKMTELRGVWKLAEWKVRKLSDLCAEPKHDHLQDYLNLFDMISFVGDHQRLDQYSVVELLFDDQQQNLSGYTFSELAYSLFVSCFHINPDLMRDCWIQNERLFVIRTELLPVFQSFSIYSSILTRKKHKVLQHSKVFLMLIDRYMLGYAELDKLGVFSLVTLTTHPHYPSSSMSPSPPLEENGMRGPFHESTETPPPFLGRRWYADSSDRITADYHCESVCRVISSYVSRYHDASFIYVPSMHRQLHQMITLYARFGDLPDTVYHSYNCERVRIKHMGWEPFDIFSSIESFLFLHKPHKFTSLDAVNAFLEMYHQVTLLDPQVISDHNIVGFPLENLYQGSITANYVNYHYLSTMSYDNFDLICLVFSVCFIYYSIVSTLDDFSPVPSESPNNNNNHQGRGDSGPYAYWLNIPYQDHINCLDDVLSGFLCSKSSVERSKDKSPLAPSHTTVPMFCNRTERLANPLFDRDLVRILPESGSSFPSASSSIDNLSDQHHHHHHHLHPNQPYNPTATTATQDHQDEQSKFEQFANLALFGNLLKFLVCAEYVSGDEIATNEDLRRASMCVHENDFFARKVTTVPSYSSSSSSSSSSLHQRSSSHGGSGSGRSKPVCLGFRKDGCEITTDNGLFVIEHLPWTIDNEHLAVVDAIMKYNRSMEAFVDEYCRPQSQTSSSSSSSSSVSSSMKQHQVSLLHSENDYRYRDALSFHRCRFFPVLIQDKIRAGSPFLISLMKLDYLFTTQTRRIDLLNYNWDKIEQAHKDYPACTSDYLLDYEYKRLEAISADSDRMDRGDRRPLVPNPETFNLKVLEDIFGPVNREYNRRMAPIHQSGLPVRGWTVIFDRLKSSYQLTPPLWSFQVEDDDDDEKMSSHRSANPTHSSLIKVDHPSMNGVGVDVPITTVNGQSTVIPPDSASPNLTKRQRNHHHHHCHPIPTPPLDHMNEPLSKKRRMT